MADENIKWDPIPSVVPQKDEGIKWDNTPKIEVSGTADDLKDYKRTSMFKEYGKPAAKVSQITKGIMAKQREDRAEIEQYERENKVDFVDLYQKPENFNVIKDYMTSRFGKVGEQKKDESNEDYAKRFATEMRKIELNTILNAVPELNWIANAKQEDKDKAGKAIDLWDRVPIAILKGGQEGIRPYAETVMSIASDPLTYTGLGIGKFATYAAARQLLKKAFSTPLRTGVTAAAVEAPISAGSNIVQQRIRIESGATEGPVDLGEAAFAGVLGSVFSGFEAAGVARKPATYKKDLEEKLAGKRKPTSNQQTTNFIEAFDREMEDVLKQFDIQQGRTRVLDEITPPTSVTDGKIKNDIYKRSLDVVKYIMDADPAFKPKKGQQMMEAVRDVFMILGERSKNLPEGSVTIPDEIFNDALKKANITLGEFGQASLTTASEMGRGLAGLSSLSRALNSVGKLDPESQRLIDGLYGRDNEIVSSGAAAINAVSRLERESKAYMVSGLGTTIRNVYGTMGALTLDAASRLLEGTIYETGKLVKSAATGSFKRGDFSQSMSNIVRDSFSTLVKLNDAGMTAETMDLILADNPKLRSLMLNSLQESGDQELSKGARFVNSLNVAQDALFRRAVFTASVERSLRRVGMDMMEILANDKKIPTSILNNAADDALKATFSYMPKTKAATSIENMTETAANYIIRGIEKFPGSSLAVPFPRFMANAIAFQYKYSPFGAASGLSDILQATDKFLTNPAAIKKTAQGKVTDEAIEIDRLFRDGTRKFSQGVVGTAMIYAAYKYRLENQDTKWNNIQAEDGSTVDIRSIFPAGPAFWIGDTLAKSKLKKEEEIKVSEGIETMAGLKLPAGTQGTIFETLPELLSGTEGKDSDRALKAIGKVMGNFVGRFMQPGQPVFSYFDLIDRESGIVRDPNVVEAEGWKDIIAVSAGNVLKSKVPALETPLPVVGRGKADLPEYLPYLREETPIRAGEFFSTLAGVRVVPRGNKLEQEVERLNLDPYQMFGSTGDKIYDRAVIKEAGQWIKQMVLPRIDSREYNAMTDREKKVAITNNMSTALSAARGIVQGDMTAKDKERVDKMAYNKLSQQRRLAINEMYKREKGVTLEDAKDYASVYEYAARLEGLR